MNTLYFLELFLAISFAFQSIKCIKGLRGALAVNLSLNDINIIICIAAFSFIDSIFQSLLFGLLCVYLFFFWLDSILFVQYKVEVNYQTVVWFLKGSKGLLKGLPNLANIFKLSPASLFVPFLLPSYLYSNQAFILLAAIVVSLFLIKKSKGVSVLLQLGVMFSGLDFIAQEDSIISSYAFQSFLAFSMVLVIVVFNFYSKIVHTHLAFFSLPATILSCFYSSALKFRTINPNELSKSLRELVFDKKKKPRKSESFASLKGANVILITVESLGAYIQPYQNLAHSNLVERLKKNAWISNLHFCLCPNTTVSTNQIYTGHYSNNPYNKLDSKFWGEEPKYIQTLKSQGYKTLFLDSADTGLYDYWKLLERIGFDKIWGNKELKHSNKSGDYRLLDMVQPIVDEVGEQPFFLHIINDQTHMPYEVIDEAKFNNHKDGGDRAVYLNAIEEVDHILMSFLDLLEKKVDLSNTVIVLTGDHGESFGEYGYNFHSNSIVKEQIQVPFIMHHPKLNSKEIEYSCHFDLFPTFFDLLGIDYNYETEGESLALNNRQSSYFFHSATLKSNTPANFGIMMNGELCWVDRLFSQEQHIDINTGRKIKKEEAILNVDMACQAMKSRKLMEENNE